MNYPIEKKSEQAILGMCLLGNKYNIDLAVDRLTMDDFFSEGAQDIFSLILKLSRDKAPIDYSSVEELAERSGQHHLTKWMTDATTWARSLPDAPNDYHFRNLKKASNSRKLINICRKTLESFDKNEVPDEIITKHQQEIVRIDSELGVGSTKTTKEVCDELLLQIDVAKANKGKLVGIPTGLGKLNHVTGGFRGGELILVAARPGVGKSIYATQLILANPTIPISIIGLEMRPIEYMARNAAATSGVSLTKIRDGSFESTYDEQLVRESIKYLSNGNVYYEDACEMTIAVMRSKLRAAKMKYGIQMAIVDYLQLLSGTDSRNKVAELGEISRGSKSLAKELNIPIVMLAQLNRDAAQGEEPALHHLRGSGELEQDSDTIVLLHRLIGTIEESNRGEHPTKIILGKQRNGAIGSFVATLHGSTSKFIQREG